MVVQLTSWFCNHLIVCVKNINHNIHKDENHCFILSFESLEFRLHFAKTSFLFLYIFFSFFSLKIMHFKTYEVLAKKLMTSSLKKNEKFRCVIRPFIIYIPIPIKDEYPAILDRTHSHSLMQIWILVNEVLMHKFTWICIQQS